MQPERERPVWILRGPSGLPNRQIRPQDGVNKIDGLFTARQE